MADPEFARRGGGEWGGGVSGAEGDNPEVRMSGASTYYFGQFSL